MAAKGSPSPLKLAKMEKQNILKIKRETPEKIEFDPTRVYLDPSVTRVYPSKNVYPTRVYPTEFDPSVTRL